MKLYLKIAWLLILIGICWGGSVLAQTESGATPASYPSETLREADYLLEQADDFYQRSGLAAYMESTTLLWTETTERRADLQQNLPPVDEQLLQQFRDTLWQAQQKEAKNARSFIFSGCYLLWKGQYDGALWNLQQALAVASGSNEARLALADFYLSRWQPDQVISLLQNQEPARPLSLVAFPIGNDPEAALRLGAAYLQKDDYFAALGYLLQAEPLPARLQITRRKDLSKAFLGIGEFAKAGQLLVQGDYSTGLEGTLLRELQGWTTWLEGNPFEAEGHWAQGQRDAPRYRFYYSELSWLKQDKTSVRSLDTATIKYDAALHSQLNLEEGFQLQAQTKTEPAYQAFLAGIKADHRSLVGFLEAAHCQMLLRDYRYAVNLCTQGLAVNGSFKPLLALRATAYLKLRKDKEAAGDLARSKEIPDQEVKSPKLSGLSGKMLNGTFYLTIDGETKNLHGLWLSPDGIAWQYQPWWGGPVYLKKTYPKLWVLPVGPDLSGEAFVIQSTSFNNNHQFVAAPFVNEDGITLNLPIRTELITAFYGNEYYNAHFYTGQAVEQFLIPQSTLPGGNQELVMWYRSPDLSVGTARFNLSLPIMQQDLKYRLSNVKPLTNRREVQFSLSAEPNSGQADYMAISENGTADTWRMYAPEFSFIVSPGDGKKKIIVKLKDRFGNIMEMKTEVTLDTSLPEVNNLMTETGIDAFQVKWHVSKACQSRVEVFAWDGVWREIAGAEAGDNYFSAQVPREAGSFCRIVAIDAAGNKTICPIIPLVAVMQADLPWHFLIAGLPEIGGYRAVSIEPAAEWNELWAVSDDLDYWSAIKRGKEEVRWRLKNSAEASPLYIKIQDAVLDSKVRYIAIPVPHP